MSTSKADVSGVFQPVTVQTPQTELKLPTQAVRIRRNGVEFLSPTPFPTWTEMTVCLQSAAESCKVRCTGVVVECNGNRHTGYLVSIVFMNLSRQSAEQLSLLAFSQRP
jgi:hypothetical protein